MKVVLFVLSLFISHSLFSQIAAGPQPIGATVQQQPPKYLGYLDINGILPLKYAPSPNDVAFEAKYWFSKTPSLQNSFGLGWQIGFNEGYGKSDTDFTADGLTGRELAYLYNYVSARYKVILGKQKIRPYAEVGGGYLFMRHELVDRPLNPNYNQNQNNNQNHNCPDTREFLREATPIRNQHRAALDLEAGLNIYLTDDVSLNVGVGGIIANNIGHLEEVNESAFLENVTTRPTAYQFSNNILQSASLKVGVTIRLQNRPCESKQELQDLPCERKHEQCCCAGKSNSHYIIDYTNTNANRKRCRK